MAITEHIKSLAETLHLLEELNDPVFVDSQGLSPEDVILIESELKEKLNEYKGEAQSYIEYKLTERMDHVILSNGISETIKTLSERKQKEDNKIASIDKWIDYVCKIAGITGLKTPVGELKYTGGDKMKVQELDGLPKDLIKFTLSCEVPVKDMDALIDIGYVPQKTHVGLPEIKKRYKTLSEEEKKKLEGKIWIDDIKSLSIKQ